MKGLFAPWYVDRLDDRSNANGRDNLDNDNGRFVEYLSLLLGFIVKCMINYALLEIFS
ncbi:hypothetical protein HYT23_04085 [Candidatus Pacearchaeota archaeon]|nr:hypothetical protein [Candidatus Pacearchaeota archaeon]